MDTIKMKYFMAMVFLLVNISHLAVANEKQENTFFQQQRQNIPQYEIRKAKITDRENLKKIYQKVAAIPGGLARADVEITDDYIDKTLFNGAYSGLALVAEYNGKLVGSIVKYKLQPKVFEHVLSEGSILVDPDFQGKGIGSKMIIAFFSEIEKNYPEILRVEIIARESNPAIKLYEKLGFKKEGRFEKRVIGVEGVLEADIPMAWFNPNYSKS